MRKVFLFLILASTLMVACRRGKDTHWDSNLLAPLAKTRVTLEDALKDTTYIKENPDNSLYVVYRDTVVDLKLSDYVTVPDTSLTAKVSLDSISLTTDSIQRPITLGEMARALVAQGNFLGTLILSSQGSSLPFSGVNGITTGDVAIDASTFFQEADLISGEMVVKMENHLPVEITRAIFSLRNNGNLSNVIVQDTIWNVLPGEIEIDTTDLSGQTVESSMMGNLTSLDLGPGNPTILVDTNDYVMVTIIVQNLHASRATAVFPTQRVIDDRSNVKYMFDNNIMVTKMAIKAGTLKVEAVSTIQDTLEFIYTLPTAKKGNSAVSVTSLMIPNGTVTYASQDFDLAGYSIDLTLDGDSVNKFPQYLVGNMFYSGNLNTMDLEDSIEVFYGLLDIQPSYIEGYLGETVFDFQEEIPFEFFKSILSGSLDLKNPEVDLTFLNSIGVDGELTINGITAVNSRTGQTVSLTAPFISSPTTLPGPRLPNVGQEVSTLLHLNKNNSNIRQFISILPDKINFDLRVHANKNGIPSLKNNFATDKSRIAAYLDVNMPLWGAGTNLTLQDTMDLDLSSAAVPEDVLDGKLRLVCKNQFPFETKVQFYFQTDGFSLVDSLFSDGPQTIPAGIVDMNGYVDTPTQGVVEAFFDQAKLTKLQNMATKAIVRFTLDTRPTNVPVKIYSTYGIDLSLVGDFRYQIGM